MERGEQRNQRKREKKGEGAQTDRQGTVQKRKEFVVIFAVLPWKISAVTLINADSHDDTRNADAPGVTPAERRPSHKATRLPRQTSNDKAPPRKNTEKTQRATLKRNGWKMIQKAS